MYVEFDRESSVQDHLHRGIEIAEVVSGFAVLRRVHHRLRIDAETHVIEPRRLDERDVGSRRPVLEMFFRVSLRVPHLREPLAQIDPVANVRQARNGHGRSRSCLRKRERREKNKDSNKSSHNRSGAVPGGCRGGVSLPRTNRFTNSRSATPEFASWSPRRSHYIERAPAVALMARQSP